MSDIIRNWLTKRLGLVLEVTNESIAEFAKDGRLFTEILHNYSIISDEQYQEYNAEIAKDDSEDNVFNNLMKYTTVWFKLLNIPCSFDVLMEIASGRGTAALRLLYQLYLKLQDKNKMHFIKERSRNENLKPINTKFDVTAVTTKVTIPPEPNTLATPLEKKRNIINWHTEKYFTLLEKCKDTHAKYVKHLQWEFAKKISETEFEKRLKSASEDIDTLPVKEEQDMTYEELIQSREKARELQPLVPDPKRAKEYINKLKEKRCKLRELAALKLFAQKKLLAELWDNIRGDNEKDYETSISKKLLKQSTYEKQMLTKMLEIREQKSVMLQNKKMINQAILEQQENEVFHAGVLRDKNIDEEKFRYYFERNRMLELHRRLYEEKLRLKKEKREKLCAEAVKDIINIALRHAEYKEEYAEEVPRRVDRKWKNLFIKGQPIFDILEYVEEVVNDLESLREDIEEVYFSELERQNALDDKEFEDYITYQYPFDYKERELDYDEETLEQMNLGMNCLGYIVHRVLYAKYPKPKKPPPPEIPPVTVAACINGIRDITILATLQKLLEREEIRVIEIQEIVNFCLAAFKNEYTDKIEEDKKAEESNVEEAGGEKRKPVKQKGKKAKPEKKKKKKKKEYECSSTLLVEDPTANKEIQTPNVFPGEEITISNQAALGKIATEQFTLGLPIADNLIAAMFIEYLKSIAKMRGWVLINYPTDIFQAGILEEHLTGVPFPKIDKEKPETIMDELELETRLPGKYIPPKSKIVPDPQPVEEDPIYETYLTAYIKPEQETEELGIENDAILTPEPPCELIENFYSEQGCNYSLKYKSFDFITIKTLAKLILGKFTVPPKTSVELFGETVLFLEEEMERALKEPKVVKKGGKKKKKGKKKGSAKGGGSATTGTTKTSKTSKSSKTSKTSKTSKSSKKSKKGEKGKKGKKGKGKKKKGAKEEEKIEIIQADKETQIPEEEIVEEEEETVVPPPKPGEPGWYYTDIPMNESFLILLGTLWENAENVYVTDMQQVFFMRRICLDAVMPYLHSISVQLHKFISRPDNKQQYMYQLQKTLNDIDSDLRDDADLKSEFHCRINEFREKLCMMCDHKMRESEEERKLIISHNWLYHELVELTNFYISGLQIEIDRFVDSMLLITDYYTYLLLKTTEDASVSKINLKKLESYDNNNEPAIMEEMTVEVANILIDPDASIENTSFHRTMEEIFDQCLKCIESSNGIASNVLAKLWKMFKPKSKRSKGDKGDKSEKGHSPRSKSKQKFIPDLSLIEASDRMFPEWEAAIQGETIRCKLHLELLKSCFEEDVAGIFGISQKIFHAVYFDIKDYYAREIESIQQACEVICQAIEAEMPIQPQLVLDGDKFYIDPNILLYPDDLPMPEPKICYCFDCECIEDDQFTIEQLEKLSKILSDLAPDGNILDLSFVYLLQDIIAMDHEDGSETLLPELWRKLKPKQVEEVVRYIFGDAEYINWKDFVIYNMNLVFPSEQELLLTRQEFRQHDPDSTEIVTDYQFNEVHFWFEPNFIRDCPRHMYNLERVKKFLFNLFKKSEFEINYTSLLLTFCKDDMPIIGFVKALELSMGSRVCWDEIIGENAKRSWLDIREKDEELARLEEEKHQENIEFMKDFVEDFVEGALNTVDGVVIEELPKSEEKVRKQNSSESWLGNESEQSLLIEHFSNVLIDHECTDILPMVYFLPFEVLITVLTVSLPWHARVQNKDDQSFRERIEVLYESCKSPEFNGSVFAHEFLNDENFVQLLKSVSKFTVKNCTNIVKDIFIDDE